MIKSMTGYGSAKGFVGDLEITVELKSVNNRYLDSSIRMPRSFLFAEDALKSAIQKHVSRGKVDMFVSVDSSAADNMTVKVNEPLLRGYLDAISLISDKYGLPPQPHPALSSMPRLNLLLHQTADTPSTPTPHLCTHPAPH